MSEPLELGDETPTALYRFYAADGALLYIGITNNLKTRFAGHAHDKQWWPEVARKTVEWHLTRDTAAAAELLAIKSEHPRHNITGVENPDRPARAARVPRAIAQPPRRAGGGYRGLRAPDEWPADYWCRIWWTAEHATNCDQYELMNEFTCPRQEATEAISLWHFERRRWNEGRSGYPAVGYQAHPDLRDDRSSAGTWSIHADVTCLDAWESFTPEMADAQSEFLGALLAAGYCTLAKPGRDAAAFGFANRHELEAQIAGTILGELMWGGIEVAVKSAEALRMEASQRAA